MTGFMLLALATAASAQESTTSAAGQAQAVTFSLGKVFTFLFLTLGPLKILGPFASMTRGHDKAARRRLAVQATLIALIAVLVAATMGANVLRKWGVSVGALLLTAGIILFLVALRPVLEQYAREPRPESPGPTASATPLPSPMALAFPTIVTPYGVAILIVLVTLRASGTVAQVLGVAAGVLLLDLLAMLYADRILKTPFVAAALGIVGAVMGVLQIALGVQAVVGAVRLLGFGSQ